MNLLLALQHADSAFPSGGFAFSNGIEGLAALGVALDRQGLTAAVIATIRHRWSSSDRVALVRAFAACGDLARIGAVDLALEAATLAEPLRMGSKRNGGALLAAHVRLATPGAAGFRSAIDAGHALGHLPVVQGFVWRAVGLSQADAIAMSGYATAAGLIAAAVRLGTIGAVDAQAALASALAVVAEMSVVEPEAEIESFAPWVDAAAARHARADLRLFAS
jgi:urease accessory protein